MSDNHSFQTPFPLSSGLREDFSLQPDLSIIVPFYNEEDCAEFVLKEILEYQPTSELIAIDDGSSDNTWSVISSIPGVTAIRLTENRGQSAAIYAGIRIAKGQIITLLDGDGQNDPANIQELVDAVASGSCQVACGRRARRKDTWSRRYASKIANSIRRTFIKDGISDTGCSLKVFRKDCVDLFVPFNGLHRFLPAIFTHAGLTVTEIDVNHRERKAGSSKYTNLDRAIRGVYDLIGVCWLLKRKIVYPPIDKKSNSSAPSD